MNCLAVHHLHFYYGKRTSEWVLMSILLGMLISFFRVCFPTSTFIYQHPLKATSPVISQRGCLGQKHSLSLWSDLLSTIHFRQLFIFSPRTQKQEIKANKVSSEEERKSLLQFFQAFNMLSFKLWNNWRVRNPASGRPKLGSETFMVENVYLTSKQRMGSNSEAGRAGRLSNAFHLRVGLWPLLYNLIAVKLLKFFLKAHAKDKYINE